MKKRRLPRIEKINEKHVLMVDDKAFIMLSGEVHNSASSSETYMEKVLEKAVDLKCNTLLTPVYWELIEKDEDVYDFSHVDQMIRGARANDIKLVLLWFGSFKNSLSTYAPNWVKLDQVRFPRTVDNQDKPTKILSMFSGEILEVEKKTFKKFMEHVKAFDQDHQTVLMIQVENEVGILGSTRDYSEDANKAFMNQVSENLVRYINQKDKGILSMGMNEYFDGDGADWKSVFGDRAEEVFMSYHYGQYINELALVGKSVYDLPMFANAWLKSGENEKPGDYPSGGPLAEMIHVWKYAAPALDFLSPDIYLTDIDEVCRAYTDADLPLFIPETRRDIWAVPNAYLAIGKYNAICYAPFGIESVGENMSYITQAKHTNTEDKNVSSPLIYDYLKATYRLFHCAHSTLTRFGGTESMTGFVQKQGGLSDKFIMDDLEIGLRFYHEVNRNGENLPAAGIVIREDLNTYLFIGYGYEAYLTSRDNLQVDYLSIQKLYCRNGELTEGMRLNGDEYNIRMEELPTAIRVKIYKF